MDKIEQLELERSSLMAVERTHTEWVKVMERLAEISSEILIIKNKEVTMEEEKLEALVDGIAIGQPPLSTHAERIIAQQKLIRMQEFIKGMKDESI